MPKTKDKSWFKPGFAAALVSLSALTPQQLMAVSIKMPVSAVLLNALDITLNASMNFGTLAMTLDRPGVVTIDPFVNQLVVDGNGGITPAGGQPRAGGVVIRGANKPVTLIVESTSVRLTNGTTFVVVDNFNFMTVSGGPQVTITPTQPFAAMQVPLGATINTRPGQLIGSYTGANRISANFQ